MLSLMVPSCFKLAVENSRSLFSALEDKPNLLTHLAVFHQWCRCLSQLLVSLFVFPVVKSFIWCLSFQTCLGFLFSLIIQGKARPVWIISQGSFGHYPFCPLHAFAWDSSCSSCEPECFGQVVLSFHPNFFFFAVK